MSNFTTQVRTVCEFFNGDTQPQPLGKVNEIVHNVHNKVIGDYPIFDEEYREVLNTKILKHYYMREIGQETVATWQLFLNNRMNEIMPYYNKLYKSELLEFNPLYDVELRTERENEENVEGSDSRTRSEERSENGTSSEDGEATRQLYGTTQSNDGTHSNTASETSGESSGTQTGQTGKNHTDRYSDTPQGGLNGMESVEQNLYLTNARLIGENENETQTTNEESSGSGITTYDETTQGNETRDDNESTHSSRSSEVSREGSSNGEESGEMQSKTTGEYVERVSGKRGGVSYAKMLMEFRESLLNIDMKIIDELEDLFFGLWE